MPARQWTFTAAHEIIAVSLSMIGAILKNISLPARHALCGMAAALALAALTGAAHAQTPLIPFLQRTPQHIPARLPKPGAQRTPLAPNATQIRPNTARPSQGFVWTPQQHPFSTVSTFTLPPLSSVGPGPIHNEYGTGTGPFDASGRVTAIAVDPTDVNTFYITAAGGGVWKTTDGGTTYTVLTDALPDLAMGALTIDPTNNQVLYAGSGEANFSADSRYGEGLYKSTDGGSTWTVYTGPSNAFVGVAISRIVVDPTNSDNVYLTTTRADNGTNTGYGVYKSTDGGATWTNVLTNGVSFTDLAIDPTTPTTLYAAAGEIFGNANNGIYKTTNGGTSWALLSGFPHGANVGRISLALAPSNSLVLYADYAQQVTSGSGGLGGFYSTTDGGATWTQAPTSTDGYGDTGVPNFLGTQGWYDDILVVDPTNASHVYAAGVVDYGATHYGQIIGLIGSFNGGSTWYDYSTGLNNSGPHTDHHALAFSADGSKLFNGNDGGVWRLENPGATPTTYNPASSNIQWTDLNTNQVITQFTGVALHPTDPTIAYGGSQDNGTEKYTGTTDWQLVRGGDGGFARLDQSNPQTVYHEYYGISLERSDDGGGTWTSISGPSSGIGQTDPVIDDGDDPRAFYVPYVLDPANQSRIIYGTNHIYESTDKGAHFTAIGIPGTNGFSAANSTNVAVAVGTYGSTVYASVGGHLYVTTNDGGSWATQDIPSGGAVSDIFINPANTFDVLVTRPSFTGGAGHVYHTTNGGATWTDISGSLPNQPYNAVKEDTVTGTLYVGGDDGVYTSTDGGANWTKAAMPNVQVVDLAISPGADLVAAGTHGRGMFTAQLPATLQSVSVSPNPVVGGQYATGTVTLTRVAPVGGETVTLSSTTTGTSFPASVSVAAGSATATFTIITPTVSTDTPADISGALNGVTQTGLYTINATPLTTAGLSGTSGSSGYYVGPVTVTLSPQAQGGRAVANTYYAIDGGAQQTYTAPFIVSTDGAHYVKFYSTDTGGNAESQKKTTFKIDQVAPASTSKLAGTLGLNGFYRSAVTVAISATDATSGVAGRTYSVDNGAAQPFTTAFTVSGDGSHTVTFHSTDKAGNVETDNTTTFKIDGTKPVTTATPQSTSAGEQITLTATDATSGVASTVYSLDGGPFQTYTAPVTVSRDGAHRVMFHSTDAAGNVEANQTASFTTAIAPPVTTSSLSGTSGTNGYYTSAVTVTLTAQAQGTSVANTYDSLDGGAIQTYTAPIGVSTDGAHTVTFYSTDTAGNANAHQSITFKIDTTPPVTTASTQAVPTGQKVTLTATDNFSGVATRVYSVDNGTVTTYTAPFTVTGSGSHTVTFHSTDKAGNAETTKSVTFGNP